MSSEDGCQLCSSGNAWLGPLLFSVVVGILGGAIAWHKERIKAWESRNREWLANVGELGTMFLITTQIIVLLKINHER